MFTILCNSACLRFLAYLRFRGSGRSPGVDISLGRTAPPEEASQVSYSLLVNVPYLMQWCFRAAKRPSGPDFGWTATGKAPKSALRPAGWPISVISLKDSGHNLARKADLRPGGAIAYHRVATSIDRRAFQVGPCLGAARSRVLPRVRLVAPRRRHRRSRTLYWLIWGLA